MTDSIQDRASSNTPSNDGRLTYGSVILVILLLIEGLMFYSTKGRLTRAYWVVLYVGVAVMTGVVFWLVTPGSTGSVDFKKLGIKLGGGAAIGAAFMLLASYLTIPTRNSIVVPLPSGLPSDFKITNLSPEDLSDLGEVRTVGGRQFIYVEFRTDHDSGNFKLDYLDQSTPRITNRSFRVTMEGEITEVTATR